MMATPWNRIEMAVMGTNVSPVKTFFGAIYRHRLKDDLFFGFDPITVIAEPEKAYLDYVYVTLRAGRLMNNCADDTIHLDRMDAGKVRDYAKRFPASVCAVAGRGKREKK